MVLYNYILPMMTHTTHLAKKRRDENTRDVITFVTETQQMGKFCKKMHDVELSLIKTITALNAVITSQLISFKRLSNVKMSKHT